jgi:hypothetical protein
MYRTILRMIVLLAVTVLPAHPAPAPAVGDHGSYPVPGLGARKQAVIAAGGNSLDLAVAMLETEHMQADYSYGDGKTGNAANFGIFKQNWFMIRKVEPEFRRSTASDYDRGAVLNTDLEWDVAVLHAAQQRWPIEMWFAGHRNGESGLRRPDTDDIARYRRAVYWIRDQIDADPANRTNDTRFWVDVAPI